MNKISIIVPIYNIEKYLYRCIDSILTQTFTNFELILVDDGSRDSSGIICDEYAVKDSRVCVIHKENGGVCSARNLGIDKASGEWIAFVDGDDWLDCKMYENLIQESKGADVVLCDVSRDYSNYSKISKTASPENGLIEFLRKEMTIGWTIVMKMIVRRTLIIKYNLRFENIRYSEDFLFSMKLFCLSSNIKYVNLPLYHYDATNESSALHNMPANAYKDLLYCEKSIIDFLKIKNIYSYLEREICWRILRDKQDLVLQSYCHDEFLGIFSRIE